MMVKFCILEYSNIEISGRRKETTKDTEEGAVR
jgi:hypothetical protein